MVELPELIVDDAGAWRGWLADNHAAPNGVWLVLAKKGTAAPTSLTYAEALEEALCHGWIDGQVQRRDATTYRQRFTPRRAQSLWSKRNVDLIGRLEEEGRMHPALPPDLAEALTASPDAQAMFGILTSQNRYAILHRIVTAKRPDTRARRAADLVAMLARGETLYPQKRAREDPTPEPGSPV